MNSLVIALAALAGFQEPAPVQDKAELRKKIAGIEKRLPELDRKAREAVEQNDEEGARRAVRGHQEARKELEALQKQLGELEAKEEGTPWYNRYNLEFQGRVTHWDNDLELHDGAGWGAAIYVKDFLFFEYRRWDGDDELSDADATVISYEFGWTQEFSLSAGKTSVLVLGGGLGLVHFATEASGRDSDTGLILSISPTWKYHFSPRLRLSCGGDFDILRTDFNQNHTHTNHPMSLFLSIELAY